MTERATCRRRELAHRSGDGVNVRLVWVQGAGEDKTVVCACATRAASYFEIPAELYRALDVYYLPFADRDFSRVEYESSRLAA